MVGTRRADSSAVAEQNVSVRFDVLERADPEWVGSVRAVVVLIDHHMGYHMVMARREVLVQLDDDLVEQLDALAADLGTNRSELMRRGAQAVLDAEGLAAADRELESAYADSPPIPRSSSRRDDSLLRPLLRGSSQRHLLGRPRTARRSPACLRAHPRRRHRSTHVGHVCAHHPHDSWHPIRGGTRRRARPP